ncbi:class I SAM-dependent methyltransferase [Bacillus sp. FJAT-42376]|uniref:class I SAM-dependent methyltransferase n=1 Tax=Bacillus sp. FJAT-42376 TaxID=2014076 RepID=UPI000F4FE67B|nr:class I SAM-dependent methyltransferase [Bacillus sp. FJAT-42376]AZB42385.1 class I SAM-dependent methyltransferase [Bacillus sp. FJAT-42376]
MERKGAKAYDEDAFFTQFMNRRYRADSPNLRIETPAMLELIGSPEGKSVLDLGCGDASLGLALLEKGCSSYLGIEGSNNMFEEAIRVLEDTEGKMELCQMEEYSYPAEVFDLVVSQLAIHYIENMDSLFHSIIHTLKPGGRFVFSLQHPLLTSSGKSAKSGEKRSDWIVDDYFHTGKRVEDWMGEQVVKYHRTAGDYFSALTEAGFIIDKMMEPKPDPALFSDPEEYRRRMRIPLFLLFSCTKE